jgi:hypothetical protein
MAIGKYSMVLLGGGAACVTVGAILAFIARSSILLLMCLAIAPIIAVVFIRAGRTRS